MAAITDYASLTSAIADWAERTYTADQTDQFIALSEAEFRNALTPNYAKETSITLGVVSGSVAQPAGLVRVLSMTDDTYGELTETTMQVIRARRVVDTSGIPDQFAVTGTTIEFAPSFDGDVTMDYEGTLTGLSGSNTTNWLISNAPQAYLSMCLSMAAARDEDYQKAALLKAASLDTLGSVVGVANVAQYGRAEMALFGGGRVP